MNKPHEFIVIPAFNEEKRLAGLLKRIAHLGYEHIVVVDDGSSDGTARVARNYHVHLIEHPINLGAGAATQTGIEYAIGQGAELIVTLDGDHQHLPEDIQNLVDKITESNADLVIGSRFLKSSNLIPYSRRFYNRIANLITFLVAGIRVSDSQSGMKVFTRRFAQTNVLNCNGFEFCVEIIRNAARSKSRVLEVPISVKYSKDTMRKGQSFYTGVKMIGRLIRMNIFH